MSGKAGQSDISVTSSPSELVLPTACCCCWQSFWCKFPECIGCREQVTCLCISYQCACGCVPISVLCKGVSSCCCLDHRCAIPCDKDVPFGIGLCGIMCVDKREPDTGLTPAQYGMDRGGV